MATVLEMMELYRAMMALLKPLERAWKSVWAGGMGLPDWLENPLNSSGDFVGNSKRNFKSSGAGGFGKISAGSYGTSALTDTLMYAFENPAAGGWYRVFNSDPAVPRKAAGFNGFGGWGAFNQAIGLPERPVRSDNGGFFYTDFGDKGADGGIGRSGERGLDTFPEKIRGGEDGSRSAGGAFVLPDYGANLGMVLDNQLIGKQISGISADGGDSGFFNFSGRFGNSGTLGENRGLLYSFERFENPENGLVPNARTEEFDLWKSMEYLRIADSLKINDDIASVERLAAVRGYAEREISDFGGYGGSKINIDMSSMKNIVNSKSDMDELIDRLCSVISSAIGEAAFSMAEGVHS